MTARHGKRTLLIALPLGIGLIAADLAPAQAQQRPRNIMEMLFGAPVVQQPQARRQQAQPRRQEAQPRRSGARQNQAQRSRQPSRSQSAAPVAAAAPAVEKSENARDVLVVGDFMAASLGRGLTEAVAQNRDLRIDVRAEGSSGLVRDDFYDWLAELPRLLEETSPDLVVVMLGSNDRQPLSLAGTSQPVRSDPWTAEYTRRAGALAEIVETRDLPLVWVGMPSFQASRMSEDMVFFNDIYRRASAGAEGEFVDIWNGFVDASGAFITSGPDPEGQPARLRNSDGITMTAAGAAKLAYYVEPQIVSRLGLSVDDLLAGLGPQQMPDGELPAAPNIVDRVRTDPIAMNDPRLDGAEALLGGQEARMAGERLSPREELVLAGSPPSATPGRADSFTWGERGPATAPSTNENAIVSRGTPPVPVRGPASASSADEGLIDGAR